MSKRLSRCTVKVLLLILFFAGIPSEAHAQLIRTYNRIVSLVEDSAGNFVLLNTVPVKPLAPPIVHYMSVDGATIMACDFPGLVWNRPTQVITPTLPGLRQIRIGQFQANPPICRIAVSAFQPGLLHKLVFSSAPGSLIIKWPRARAPMGLKDLSGQGRKPQNKPGLSTSSTTSSKQKTEMPQAAPSRAGLSRVSSPQKDGSAFRQEGNEPAIAPPRHKLPTNDRKSGVAVGTKLPPKGSSSKNPDEEVKPQLSNAVNNARPAVVSDNMPPAAPDRHIAIGTGAHTGVSGDFSNDQDNPKASNTPIVTIEDGNPTLVKIASDRPLNYHAFWLHQPERYVIDLKDFPQLQQCAMPLMQPGSAIQALRNGHPESDASTSRLVIDLAGTAISVKEALSEERKILTLFLQKVGSPPEEMHVRPGTMLVIDAGHGGSDPGAQRGDIQEKEITLDITEKLAKKLGQAGAKIVMTRSDDSFVSLEDRVAKTNSSHPNAFVSVHINSLESNSRISGIETYYQTEQSRALAESIHKSLVSSLAAPDRGVRKARFYVINRTSVPAILAEVGFISNKEERDKLISSDYQEQVATALARGVILYLSAKPYQETSISHLQSESKTNH